MKFIKQTEKQFKKIVGQINIANIKKYKYAIGTIALILIIIPTVFFVFKKPSYVSVADKELAGLNSDIKKEVVNNKTFDSSVLEKLASLLTKRKDVLKKEFYENPSLVDKHSLESDVKSKIPSDLLSLVEKDTKINGNLEAIDTYESNGEGGINYSLKYSEDGQDKTAEVFVSDKTQYLTSVENAEVSGVYLDNYIMAAPEQVIDANTNEVATSTVGSLPSPAAHADRVLVVKIDFQDKKGFTNNEDTYSSGGSKDKTDEYIREQLFQKANAYFNKVSFGKYGLKEAAITDWITVPYNSTEDCGSNYQKWQTYAINKATRQLGFDNSDYDKVVFNFGINGCKNKKYVSLDGSEGGGGSAFALLGGKWSTYFNHISTNTYIHELGHNLGLAHSVSNYKCDDKGVCSCIEYGDGYDIMGHGTGFSVLNRYKLGWLDENRVINLDKPGRYTLAKPSRANSIEPENLFLITNLESIKKSPIKSTTQNSSNDIKYNIYYSYYEYYGAGSFIKRHTDTTNKSYSFLDDLSFATSNDLFDKSYVSTPGSPITIGSSEIKIISYDVDKITFDIERVKSPYTINKIDISGVTHSVSDDEYNYKITAGEKVDLGDRTFAEVKSVGSGISGLTYDWNGADSSGVFDSTVSGIHSITASRSGVTSNVVKIMVVPSKMSKLGISPNTTQEVTVNQPIQFTASGQDIYGNATSEILSYSWTGADANGLFVANKPGDYQVKVTGGGYESTIVNVKVKPAPLDHISINPEVATTIEVGESVQFKAYGRDQYGNGIEGTTYAWTGTDANGLFTSKTPGVYQIKVTSGNIVSKEVTVTVTPAPLDHITIAPNSNQTINSGQSIKFIAQGQDQFNNNIPGLIYNWVGADASGNYTGKDAGIYIVKASSGSISSGVVNVVVAAKSGSVSVKSSDTTDNTDNTVTKPVLTTVTKNGEKSNATIDDTVTFTNSEKAILSGKGTPGSTVAIFIGEKTYDAVVTTDGDWSTEISSGEFESGKYTITAQAKKGDSSSELTRLTEAQILKPSTDSNTTQDDKKDTSKDIKTTETSNQVSSIFSNPIFIGVVSVICLVTVSGVSYFLLHRYYNR